jgi:hypothetical protein
MILHAIMLNVKALRNSKTAGKKKCQYKETFECRLGNKKRTP